MNVGQREPRTITSLCLLLGYSRQALYQYQHRAEKQALQEELLLQQVSLHRSNLKRCGTRKLFHLLQGFMQEHGISIGRDALFDLLREHGLLVRKRRRKGPRTTFSHHWLHKYPNLIVDFIPTAPNQLWVSDITYIELEGEFAYLSLITDVYSHKIVGYYLSEDLSAQGPLAALEMALRQLPENFKGMLIHHSDRGVQYCCEKYVALLLKHSIRISMTQSGNPRENPVAERANGIFKDEFLFDIHFKNIEQARYEIAAAVSIYNNLRPHLSIELLTPAQAHARSGVLKKRWKNYYNPKKRKEAANDLV
jgi:putative transposase